MCGETRSHGSEGGRAQQCARPTRPTPSGRSRPSGFGMYALRDGFARYAPAMHPSVQIPKVLLEILPVLLPRHAIHPRRGLRAEAPKYAVPRRSTST